MNDGDTFVLQGVVTGPWLENGIVRRIARARNTCHLGSYISNRELPSGVPWTTSLKQDPLWQVYEASPQNTGHRPSERAYV